MNRLGYEALTDAPYGFVERISLTGWAIAIGSGLALWSLFLSVI